MKLATIHCPCCGDEAPFAIDFEERKDEAVEGVLGTFWCGPCGQHRRGDWMIRRPEEAQQIPRIRRLERRD